MCIEKLNAACTYFNQRSQKMPFTIAHILYSFEEVHKYIAYKHCIMHSIIMETYFIYHKHIHTEDKSTA